MVGIVVVSHSSELAEGLAALAAQMAGPDVRIEPAGGNVRLVDAPIVEGAVAAAVTASANMPLDDVARSAEDARGAGKL